MNSNKKISRKMEKNYKNSLLRDALVKLMTDLILTALFLFIVFTFAFGITIQSGNDMYPALRDGDVLIYFRHPGLIQTEAVVYEYSGILRSGRIAAVPGNIISETEDHQLTIDGVFQPEEPELGLTGRTYSSPDQDMPFTIGQDSYYLLNDNRTRMNDSRKYGAIDRSLIRGSIITVIRRRGI